MDQNVLFISGNGRIKAAPGSKVRVKELVTIGGESTENIRIALEQTFCTAPHTIGAIRVIKGIELLALLQKGLPGYRLQQVGSMDIVLEVNSATAAGRKAGIGLLVICLLLFLGSALTIISFHDDVNMAVTHQLVYRSLTGEDNQRPITLQIPYSLGLGLGMMLFFKHIGVKSARDEPSPLEVEMHLYEQHLLQAMQDRGQEISAEGSAIEDG